MAASQFVGRVGGLAVALGVGAAVFATAGVASADRDAPDTRGSDNSNSQSSASERGVTTGSRGASAVSSKVVAQQTRKSDSNPTASTLTADEPISVPPAAAAESAPVVKPAAAVAEPAAAVVESAPAPAAPAEAVVPDPVVPDVVAEPAPEEAPAGEVVAYSATGSLTSTGGAGSDPSAPVGHPIVDLLLASFIRRETASASATATASATTAALEFNPQTVYFDGILQGNLNVASANGCGELGSDCKLEFSFVDSSDGGKVRLNNVPNGLPGGAPFIQGTNGSYTFLPYATWIDPDNPTQHPTPTGTQDFTVRVTENTKFDQTITGIPLVGLIAAPIIKLLQTTPFLGNLLAPIIGATATTTVTVNVGQLVTGGKQVAYTYFVDSFDGTPISMNYFPASGGSLVLPGQYQATIFNGPGLGAPGETNPYATLNAGGSAPPVSLMRGQGLPAPFDKLPLGFNVITWDPRGEWASGGVLQLDNPFYEGRDVSALIDWGLANTPLLTEDILADPTDPNSDVVAADVPEIAMMGGSYGGGIQMTTVDPRIQAVVPSIAWNSLNESLYPNDVFKTAWANVLASALLLPPGNSASGIDRVNSQITQALITGNLFGFITETAQAVLSSSGPTTLLSKLNAPVMFNQGIVDALFPLQQAVENAQTLLETNPYLNGTIAPAPSPWNRYAALTGDPVAPKMIWFCGGHGVCTTQTPAQQLQQATAMFLEDMIWVNTYTKQYLWNIPVTLPGIGDTTVGFFLALANSAYMEPFQWWDQSATALASDYFSWTSDFQDGTPVAVTGALGGRINSFTSRTGPLTEQDPAAEIGCAITASACSWPFSHVFATEARNAVNVDINVPDGSAKYVVGQPLVGFTYKGTGNAKAVYAQIVDNATGQVLGNINTPIPVILDGREHTIEEFPIANIAYTAPTGGGSLTLQLVGNSSLYANNAVIWSVDISDISVELPTTTTAKPNPIVALLP